MADAYTNFAYSTVKTAPSPATSGSTLVVQSGDGASFPAAPFDATVVTNGAIATSSDAEIVRVTAKAGDTFTIVRGPQAANPGGINRSIGVGDEIFCGLTARNLNDIYTAMTKIDGGNASNVAAAMAVEDEVEEGE